MKFEILWLYCGYKLWIKMGWSNVDEVFWRNMLVKTIACWPENLNVGENSCPKYKFDFVSFTDIAAGKSKQIKKFPSPPEWFWNYFRRFGPRGIWFWSRNRPDTFTKCSSLRSLCTTVVILLKLTCWWRQNFYLQ